MPDAGLVYACITHVPVWIEPPPWVATIHLGQAQGEGRLNLRDLAPQWEPHHPVLGGTAGSFALRRHVEQQRPEATRIGICQYRKFVSPRRISRRADPKYPGMDIVPRQGTDTTRLAAWLDPGQRPFVVCTPFRLSNWRKRSGLLEQYERVHHAEDLLRIAAQAVESGVLGRREAHLFLEEDEFIPGGIELGVFPAPFWLRAIAEVEDVIADCIRLHPVLRDDYQARAWSFCAERLGSYLLLRHFRGGPLRRVDRLLRWRSAVRTPGRMNLIADGDGARYVVGT